VNLMRGISTTIGEFLGRKRVEQEAQRLKDEFVSLVSHELRTPLTSILGYVELMRDEELSDEGRRFVGVIERNSARLLSLVGDLLLIAQIEASKLVLDRSRQPLRRLCELAVDAAAPVAAAKGVALELAVRGDASVDADPERLGQVLDNLISNGIKFTPAGGRVDVALEIEGALACVVVADTGAGIPEEEQDRLFERFFRSSTAKRDAVPGTGLGLAITKALVEAHGGRIAFESEDGAGTTFTVELPVADATQEADT
jgi:signal transduction histidine kinase